MELKRQGKIIKRNPLSIEVKKSLKMLIIALTLLILTLIIIFLIFTSQSSQLGNILQAKQQEKEDLLVKNRSLIDKIIDAVSLKNIEENPLIKEMVPAIGSQQYVK